MIKPAFLQPDDQPTIIGKVFGAPLVVKGQTGYPLLELVTWGFLTWVARLKHPEWSSWKHVLAGGVASALTFVSEWCHNLAHVAGAYWIGKPADAIRIFWGTPLLIYYDPDDLTVTPRQHLVRALGGPVFSISMLPVTWLVTRLTRSGSLMNYLAGFALGINSIISCASLLPIPGLDGGAILRWSLVEKGRTRTQADQVIQKVNRLTGSGLAAASGIAFMHRNKGLGLGLALFAAISLAIGFYILKEHE